MMAAAVASAAAERLYVDWEELEPLVVGRTVSLVLPSGAVPRGQVLDVQLDRLILQVRGREPVVINRPFVRNLMIEEDDGDSATYVSIVHWQTDDGVYSDAPKLPVTPMRRGASIETRSSTERTSENERRR